MTFLGQKVIAYIGEDCCYYLKQENELHLKNSKLCAKNRCIKKN